MIQLHEKLTKTKLLSMILPIPVAMASYVNLSKEGALVWLKTKLSQMVFSFIIHVLCYIFWVFLFIRMIIISAYVFIIQITFQVTELVQEMLETRRSDIQLLR